MCVGIPAVRLGRRATAASARLPEDFAQQGGSRDSLANERRADTGRGIPPPVAHRGDHYRTIVGGKFGANGMQDALCEVGNEGFEHRPVYADGYTFQSGRDRQRDLACELFLGGCPHFTR